MSAGRRSGDRRGLTLIELVLTLTILAIAGGLVSGALATALRSWQSGLRAGREELVARIVLERLAAQLRAAVQTPARRDNADAVAFDAGEDHLRFVTMAAGATPTQVFYGLEDGAGGRRLVYREHPWPDKEFFTGGRPRREERVAEVTGFSVKVVKRTDRTQTPAQTSAQVTPGEWNPADGELPARVEVEIEVGGEGGAESHPYASAVPVLARKAP